MLKSRRPLVCCSVIHVRSIRATQHGKYFIMKRTHNCEVRIYFFLKCPGKWESNRSRWSEVYLQFYSEPKWTWRLRCEAILHSSGHWHSFFEVQLSQQERIETSHCWSITSVANMITRIETKQSQIVILLHVITKQQGRAYIYFVREAQERTSKGIFNI